MRKQILAAALLCLAAPAAAAERNSQDGQEALEIFRTIIEMHTAAGHNQVPKEAEYLASKFRAAGFADSDIEMLPVGETTGLIVRYRGKANTKMSPILFLGHMDVVEAKRDDWERDPFTLAEADGRFYGRGTDDNKFGIAQLTSAFLRLKRSGFVPSRDLIIAFSGDEESGMLTTRALVAKLAPLKPEFALNSDAGGGALTADGKPLAYAVQVAEKTFASFEITIRNKGGHSSRPRPDNAIYELADALEKVRGHAFPVQSNVVTRGFFKASGMATPGDLGKAMLAFSANPDDVAAQAAITADPAYVGMIRTTCVPTLLKGGHAENALPQSATATINCRIFPGTKVEDVRATLAEVAGNPAAEWATMGNPTTSPVSEPRADVMAAVTKAVHARYPGLPVVPYMESGGTDGMHFRNAGVPAFAVSSLFMNPAEMYAHGLNERVPVDAFFAAMDHWPTIIKALASK